MQPTQLLTRFAAAMDRTVLPRDDQLILSPVCVDLQAEVGVNQMSTEEAREIMGEIDAKSSALLAVLAILLAASAFLFSLSQSWLSLALMFAQVAVISISIVYLLRCLVYEPTPHLRHMFEMEEAAVDHPLQIEAIKQVRYFNRVILQTVVTAALFFAMAGLIGFEAMAMADAA